MSEPPHTLGPGDPSDDGTGREAEGDLDPEIVELVRRAAASDAPIAKLVRPLPPDTTRRLVERALAVAPRPKVVPLPRRARWPRWTAFAAAAAMVLAVVVAVFFLIGRPTPPQRTAYVLELKGDATQRSDDPEPAGPVKLRPTTRLRARLAPVVPVRDKLLRVLVVRGGKAELLDRPPYAVAADGAITLDAPAREALGEQQNGPAELIFVVGRQPPSDEAAKRFAEDRQLSPDADFDILRRDVLFEGWGTTGQLDPGTIEFARCESVVLGPACEASAAGPGADALGRACEVPPSGELLFWVPAKRSDLSVQVDGHPVAAESELIEGGVRVTFKAPPSSREARIISSSGDVDFCLPLRAALDAPALREARALMRENRLALAERKVAEAERSGRPDVLLQARRLRARIARRGGDRARMVALLDEAIPEDHAAGRLSDEVEDRHLRAHHRMTREIDFAAAREDLNAARELERQCPEHRTDGDYHRSILAGETGQLEEELTLLRSTRARARRLGVDDLETVARSQMLDALALLGRHDEAARLVDDSLAASSASGDPCLRTRLVTTAAWALLRGADSPGEVERAATSAADAVDTARSKCQSDLPNALLNLAFAELSGRQSGDAKKHLAEARRLAEPDDARFLSWSDALAIELSLAGRPEEALPALESLRWRGERSLSPEVLFRAAQGRARVFSALGRTADARAAFVEAEDVLDRWSALVPLGEGRESFFVEHERWARAAVDFHVRLAEAAPPGAARDEAVGAAAAVAQRSLTRFFDAAVGGAPAPDSQRSEYSRHRQAADRALAAKKPLPKGSEGALREAQERARDGLSGRGAPPVREAEAGTLALLFHPVADGWVGFAVSDDSRVTLARIPSFRGEMLDAERSRAAAGQPPSADLTCLLAPFAERIDRSSVLRVPAHGPLRRVRFEALPWKGGALADQITVVHGFDRTPARDSAGEAASACTGAPRALLVTNPDGDLAGAEAAAPHVRDALEARGWNVAWLAGKEATRSAVLDALRDPCTALFHYDGHGRFKDAGADSLGAALTLRDASLTVRDILDLPRVPRTAVLLGCVTARDEGMGLAQAFLVRGAREVLAATEAVEDALSRALAEHLYDGARPAAEGTPALAPALRAATAALRVGGAAPVPWWVFRVIAP